MLTAGTEFQGAQRDESRRGGLLKREEALRLYDLYRRYRPQIRSPSSLPDEAEADRAGTLPSEVYFDAKVAQDLLRVLATSGYILEAEQLVQDLSHVDTVESAIAAVPLILAYSKIGRLQESAKIFQRVLNKTQIPAPTLLEALRLMLHACAEADRLDVAWELWETINKVPEDSARAPRLTHNEWSTMAFVLAKRKDYPAVLKLFDAYRTKYGDVEAVMCLRIIRALKRLPSILLEERGALTDTLETGPPILPAAAVDQFRTVIESWIRRSQSNEASLFASGL